MSGLLEWVLFVALSIVAVGSAAGMLLTMSMYRAGLALMSSFIALAGLFLMLQADLLAAVQIMMNVGGMLVMILFMVMMMTDPGGEMMWDMKRDMKLPGPGALSMAMPGGKPEEEGRERGGGEMGQHGEGETRDWTCPMHPEVGSSVPGSCPICGMALVPRAPDAAPSEPEMYTCPMHPEVRQKGPGSCPICGMALVPAPTSPATEGHGGHTDPQGMARDEGHGRHGEHAEASHSGHSGMTQGQHFQMMVDMAMSTAQLPWALVIGAASAVLLLLLVAVTPWPVSPAVPTLSSAVAVGELLLSRYMIGFEGAAFLILAGISGAVILGKREVGRARTPTVEANVQPPTTTTRAGEVFTCPMHPEVEQLGPGQCPICGMNLVPARDASRQGDEARTPAGEGAHHHHSGHGGGS